MERFDVLVIGGGPGGAAAALLLARAGWSVGVLERQTFPRRKVCGEYLSATNLPLLDHLGVGAAFRERAGPPVCEVGLFAGDATVRTALPRPRGITGWGRALSREHLDLLLLDQARQAGAVVMQPWSAERLTAEDDGYTCLARCGATRAVTQLRGDVIVAAHGSWQPGSLLTQVARREQRGNDLFGFKTHFEHSALPVGLMPLLTFPGGYGGMVHTDGNRVTLSCCVRRDQLEALRQADPQTAGEVVLHHILRTCRGAREALASATRAEPWLAAGPIRPGIRLTMRRSIFPVGNLAAEAHPVVAEGISMALQGAWLLARELTVWARAGRQRDRLVQVQQGYAAAWKRHFATRVHVAAAVAHWAMRPMAVRSILPWVRCWPHVLHWGARLSGKGVAVFET